MTKTVHARFQFLGIIFQKFNFEFLEGKEKPFEVDINPVGFLNHKEGIFQLQLQINITDESSFECYVRAIADFKYDKRTKQEVLRNMFSMNSTAIVFPYMRAFVAQLTAISGYKTINIPTFNLTGLAGKLEKNMVNVNEEVAK